MKHNYECWADRDGICRVGCSCKCHEAERQAFAQREADNRFRSFTHQPCPQCGGCGKCGDCID